MTVRIGTSGWVYKHWGGLFYPADMPQSEWFARYIRAFDTVEINNSFYRLPSEAAFEAWREQAPIGFCYAVKASRYLTHLKKLKDPEDPLRRFFERASRLGDTLGVVLYQLPPRWHLNLERFERFLACLPADYRHAIEFRDASWLIEEVFRMMERYQVAHCIHDMPPLAIPPRVTAPLVYIRFHGGAAHGGDYQPAALEAWARRIGEWQDQGHDVFAYFNNDVGGYAITNAQMLRDLLGVAPYSEVQKG
jgi:uncharacterized protein YecE (DUF72 family)